MFGDTKRMLAMLKQMGINVSSIKADKVEIKTQGKTMVINNTDVLQLEQAGKKTFIIEGNSIVETRNDKESEKEQGNDEIEIKDEDIDFVMKQANVSKENAKKALIKSKGDIAEAILIAKEL
jgi:nascent polypeptide-associated complex subunit alpha